MFIYVSHFCFVDGIIGKKLYKVTILNIKILIH